MKVAEASERLSRMLSNKFIGADDRAALRIAQEALNGNPCGVCVYQPPDSEGRKPCSYCPATAAVNINEVRRDERKCRKA